MLDLVTRSSAFRATCPACRRLRHHRGRLDELVPIENAAMEDRTVIEWDKDDLDALGILKVDVLALGMLTCIRKAFDLLERTTGRATRWPRSRPRTGGLRHAVRADTSASSRSKAGRRWPSCRG
jgi:hypothetical protein